MCILGWGHLKIVSLRLIHVCEPSSISRMSIVEKYKDMGTMVMGKVISGECSKNQSLTIMPNKVSQICVRNYFNHKVY